MRERTEEAYHHANEVDYIGRQLSYMAIPSLPRTRNVAVDRIIEAVTNMLSVTFETMCGKSRKREIAEARHLSIYFLKKCTNLTLLSIGKMFGGRDHTTALHSINTVKDLLSYDDRVKRLVKALEDKI